jgi:hypothetical protein
VRVTADAPPDRRDDPLRAFLGRLLGWTRERAIDAAFRSIDLAASHLAAIVLCGAGDMVPIARSLHRRTLGSDRPFVTCDPHRIAPSGSVRVPENRTSGMVAFEAAVGGTLCLRSGRLPQDLPALIAQLRDTRDVMLVVCAPDSVDVSPFVIRPAPIVLPPLAARDDEINRIISEYAADAVAELGVARDSFTERDLAWVREHAATSLDEIEKATLRLTAIRASDTMSTASARLRMAQPSLLRWIHRRRLPARRSES